MSKTLVIGDLHGNFKGFKQALERCNFDYENDILISLGDVVDGHSQSFEVVEELLKIKNLIAIKGNHDDWFLQWIKTGVNPANWQQGQKATGLSYLSHSRPDEAWFSIKETPGGGKHYIETIKSNDIPDSHINFFENQLPYYLDNNNRLFVHGGFNRHFSLEDPIHNDEDILMWDRDLWSQALSWESMGSMEIPCTCECHKDPNIMHMMACCHNGVIKQSKPKFKMVGDFEEVFIGHTSTQFWKEDKPMNAANIWNLDTGGGWYGYITIMDINTKEFWQSDSGKELYPEFKGR